MPPSSNSATLTYAASGTPATGGIAAKAAAASSKTRPRRAWLLPSMLAPRPLRVCAGGRRAAMRAGKNAPKSAAATPSAPNTMAAPALHCKGGVSPEK